MRHKKIEQKFRKKFDSKGLGSLFLSNLRTMVNNRFGDSIVCHDFIHSIDGY